MDARPIFWHQGLFLQPHHFQYLDLYNKSLLSPVYEYLIPYLWGIAGLELRESALENKTFEVVRGTFLFPGLTEVDYPGNALLEPRSFEDAWTAPDKPLTVYVGMRKLSANGSNVTASNDLKDNFQVRTRFIVQSNPEEIPDIHLGGTTGKIRRMYHSLKIFWETEKEEIGDYDCIPVARLERQNERIVLSHDYVPPTLCLLTSETLLGVVKDIRDQLTARGRQLEEFKSLKDLQTGEFESRYISFIMALLALNRFIPMINEVTLTSPQHPYFVCQLLKQIIGELSSFSENINVLGDSKNGDQILPPYDHLNPLPFFHAAQKIITQILEDISVGPEHLFRLDFDGKFYGIDGISKETFHPKNHFFLIIRSEMPVEYIRDAVDTSLKLSSKQYLMKLIDHSLPGITLEYQSQAPREMSSRKHCHFFRIDHKDRQWEKIVTEQSIAVFWENPPDDLKMEVMVLRRA